MFNQYSSTVEQSFNYNINAVSGTLRKSHPKSKITKVPLDDPLLDKICPTYFTEELKTDFYRDSQCREREHTYFKKIYHSAVILQVMLCGDGMAVVEFVLEEDFAEQEREEGEPHD